MSVSKIVLLILTSGICSVLLVFWVIQPWFSPDHSTECYDSGYVYPSRSAGFKDCLIRDTKRFLEKDYAESKDLAKTFLTLLTGILVASITFSEKIVDINNSRPTPLVAMIGSWVLLLMAIGFAGSGLATMAVAAGSAAYDGSTYRPLEFHAVALFVLGSIAFGGAMLALIVAGTISLTDKRAAAHSVNSSHP